jgi:hypothetical protein
MNAVSHLIIETEVGGVPLPLEEALQNRSYGSYLAQAFRHIVHQTMQYLAQDATAVRHQLRLLTIVCDLASDTNRSSTRPITVATIYEYYTSVDLRICLKPWSSVKWASGSKNAENAGKNEMGLLLDLFDAWVATASVRQHSRGSCVAYELCRSLQNPGSHLQIQPFSSSSW